MGLLNWFFGGKKVATKIEETPIDDITARQLLELDGMTMQNFFDSERLRELEKHLEIEDRKKRLIKRLSSW